MTKTGAPSIGEAEVARFEADGVLPIRGLLDANAVAALQDAVAWSMANPGPHARDFAGDGAEAPFFADVFVWTRNPDLYRPLVLTERVGAIAGRLMRSQTVRFFFDHLLVKEPGSSAPTPWHQDAPYWTIEGRQCLSLWVALDRVRRENGAVEYVRGSHRWGKYFAPEGFEGTGRLKNESLDRVPPIESDRSAYDLVTFDLEPGDAVVHHCLTLHGAPGNVGTERRRGLALRFIGDDIVYATRPGIPEPMTESIEALAPGLVEGRPYDGEAFPLLWKGAA